MEQKLIDKIIQVVRYFETGKVTGADYGCISIFNDGPGNRKQVTYGASQTTEYGNLKELIEMYVNAHGQISNLKVYLPKIGDQRLPSLCNDGYFMAMLKNASTDPIMHTVQDAFFMKDYLNPAEEWFTKNGFTLPLSLLVIYDSFVQSGSILQFLRDKFAESTPAAKGDEKVWITDYVNARDTWLRENTQRPILENTHYRPDSFIYAIKEDNWMLDKPFAIVRYKNADESDKPVVEDTIA